MKDPWFDEFGETQDEEEEEVVDEQEEGYLTLPVEENNDKMVY
jgi:hypothetical protein